MTFRWNIIRYESLRMNKEILAKNIEALLFAAGEPLTLKKLGSLLEKDSSEIEISLSLLKHSLQDRGIVLLQKDDEVSLGTSPETSDVVLKMLKEEREKELSKASLETLSIILYRSPVSRAEIDYVRGVSSTFTLRSLMVRGLIEKIENPGDKRSFLYRPTFDILSHLGITKLEDLPEYEALRTEMEEKTKTIETQTEETN